MTPFRNEFKVGDTVGLKSLDGYSCYGWNDQLKVHTPYRIVRFTLPAKEPVLYINKRCPEWTVEIRNIYHMLPDGQLLFDFMYDSK